MDINLTAGGDLDTNLHVGGDMDTVLGPDEVVLVLGCRLLLYVGMFKCILWYSSAVGLTKWIYTTKQGAEGFFFTLWKAFRSVFSRHQQHSPLRDADSPILPGIEGCTGSPTSPGTEGCRNNCWTRLEIQAV
jgi:hypothetical protein